MPKRRCRSVKMQVWRGELTPIQLRKHQGRGHKQSRMPRTVNISLCTPRLGGEGHPIADKINLRRRNCGYRRVHGHFDVSANVLNHYADERGQQVLKRHPVPALFHTSTMRVGRWCSAPRWRTAACAQGNDREMAGLVFVSNNQARCTRTPGVGSRDSITSPRMVEFPHPQNTSSERNPAGVLSRKRPPNGSMTIRAGCPASSASAPSKRGLKYPRKAAPTERSPRQTNCAPANPQPGPYSAVKGINPGIYCPR